ncbi:uncharacterized protein LOC115883510 isoform X2 [Sitophilus oryzae]|uniref:Uncharacterized protein LOC115883510 isoform X2 n=1 Tax=Sitophilus oryzae TaxID=7048 RepID=A0A6J2Y481_SITOR|nr:uncharacterized protein LOC115883510 isoform X2 [Sitophilus oryzae]
MLKLSSVHVTKTIGISITVILEKCDFKSWFPGFGFFLLVVCLLILIVITLTDDELSLPHLVPFIVVFCLFLLYTECISRHYSNCIEKSRIERERYLSLAIPTALRGKCERVPLKSPSTESRTSKNSTRGLRSNDNRGRN